MGLPDGSQLELFDNPAPERDYEIVHTAHEFTSVCPVTGHPDFGTLTFTYVPDAVCVELKSLKLWLQSFRNEGVFYEAAVNHLCDVLSEKLGPRRLEVRGEFSVRGGMSTVVIARYPDQAS